MSSNIPYSQIAPPGAKRYSLHDRPVSYPETEDNRQSELEPIYERSHENDPPFSPGLLPPGAGAPAPVSRFYGLSAEEGGPNPSFTHSDPSFRTPSYHPIDDDRDVTQEVNFDQPRHSDYRRSVLANEGTTPTFGYQDTPFIPPQSYHDEPYNNSEMNASAVPIPLQDVGGGNGNGYREFAEKNRFYESPRKQSTRKAWLCTTIAVVILIVAAAVAVPVYFFVIKPHSNSASSDGSSGSSGSSSSSGGSPSSGSGSGGKGSAAAITGTDGSIVTTDNGTTFTYNNTFGGYWYWDPKDPFNNGARAQSYVPALNETWDWNNNHIFGVNLGGWLNTEPFISPALYEPFYPNAVDEYTLSQLLANSSSGLQGALEEHYATFITEEDFAQIAAAGLNWVRIPLPYWAIETWDGEPFLEGVAWKYFLKAIQWARKYGIRINLDFHAAPGSQNGWNHSGKLGQPNFLYGPMGLANADRSLDYLRILVQFISQPQYKDVVPMLGLLNEALTPNIGTQPMYSFYVQAHGVLREITGTGTGNGPILSLHDGFVGVDPWAGLFPGSDRLALDIHPYFSFAEQSNAPIAAQGLRACQTWGSGTNSSMGAFGITAAGEFSNAINDCGTYVNGVGIGTRYEGNFPGWTEPALGSCSTWLDYKNYDQPTKDGMKQFAMASMDSLTNWFFWTWKIGANPATGEIEAPFWSYQLGLQEGWMPTDPRTAYGVCASLGVPATSAPPVPATATGGAGAGTISAAFAASYTPWPVTSLASIASANVLPTYTATGTLKTMPGPTFTTPGSTATFDAGSGWFNSADTVGAHVPVAGCTYFDQYVLDLASQPPLPTAACVGSAAKKAKRNPAPAPTPAPKL
ncbi:hypothetical protein FRB96_007556 [Tulasnella sp. 330]|nr:hypothetical protein FRB96_007556 [Tulasnella sp. 330]KAG8887976.1 hypothetical protein FRB98_008649 [Tulasnella sp. 332]